MSDLCDAHGALEHAVNEMRRDVKELTVNVWRNRLAIAALAFASSFAGSWAGADYAFNKAAASVEVENDTEIAMVEESP